MLSVNLFCNISSYDILAYITKNYIALIYYVVRAEDIVHDPKAMTMPYSGQG